MSEGITSWWCGGCGAVHGWDCPYYPRDKIYTLSDAERAKIEERIVADRKAGRWPFPVSENNRARFPTIFTTPPAETGS